MVNVSNPGAFQFAPYSHSAAIGAGVTFVPPAKTIIMTSELSAAQDLSVMLQAEAIRDGNDNGVNSYGWIGSIYCEGTNVGFKNLNIADKNIRLYGVSMA